MDTFGNDLSSGGQVLSREELIRKRLRSGQCPTCGERCFKKKLFKLEPLTVTGRVLNGRCLTCNPQDPSRGEELEASCVAVAATPTAGRISHGRSINTGTLGGSAGPNLNAGLRRTASNRSSPNLNLNASLRRKAASKMKLPSIRLRGQIRSTSDIGEEDNDDEMAAPSRSVRRLGSNARSNVGEVNFEGPTPDRCRQSIGSRDSVSEHRDSSRENSFLQRKTTRPSEVFLEGINIEDLFKDDAEPTPHPAQHSNDHGAIENGDTAAPPSPIAHLTAKERLALQKLNSDSNSFLDIVTIMLANSLSATVQNEGLHALSLIHDPEVEMLEECARNCGFEVIVAAMEKCIKDAMAQTNACKILFIASASSEHLQITIGEAGGIEALVDAMREFNDDVIVLEGCLLALSNLCIPEESVDHSVEGNLIELAVNAMSQNVDNCGLQEHGCAVLANLAVHENARGKIRGCGGCDTVVVSMVVNPMDLGVQCQALIALRNMCVKDNENKVLLANAGAIDVVIQAMQNHQDDAQLQAQGAWVLGIIGMNEDNKLYIGENGGADVIVRSMWVHAHDQGVQEKACRALWTLSVHPQNRWTMMEIEAIPAIIATMQKNADNPNIQERGCGVLSNMAANDDNIKVQIVQEGALDVTVMAMVLHGENEMIQERAVALLHKLCIPENVERMIIANVSPMMAVVTENFPACQERASYVLAQLEVT